MAQKPKYEVKKNDKQESTPTPASTPEPEQGELFKDAPSVEKSTDAGTPSSNIMEENPPAQPNSEPSTPTEPENPLPTHKVEPLPNPSTPLTPTTQTTAPSKSVVGTMVDVDKEDVNEEDFVFVKFVQGAAMFRNIKTGEKVFANKMVAIQNKARVYPFENAPTEERKKNVIEVTKKVAG